MIGPVPYHGIGNRNGPRFTVGWHHMVSCSTLDAVKPFGGVAVVDNHNGFALGRLYAIAVNEDIARDLVVWLNAQHERGLVPSCASCSDTGWDQGHGFSGWPCRNCQ